MQTTGNPPVSSKPTTTLISLLLLLHLTTTASTTPIPGLDTFFSQQFRLDPHATNDTLPLLPPHLKPSLLSLSTPPSTTTSLSSLLSLTLPIPIHVILVGPTFTTTSSSTLSSLLSSLHSSSPFHVITPFSDSLHSLSLHHNLLHSVSLSSPSLSSSLSSAISSAVSSTPSSLRSSLISVAHSVVDSVISSDFKTKSSSSSSKGYTIYLINLGPQSKPYAYTYSSNPSTETSSPSFTKCLGSIFQSTDRYLWIDLSAGPVDYGPSLSGITYFIISSLCSIYDLFQKKISSNKFK